MKYAAVIGHMEGDYVADIRSEDDIEMIEESCDECGDSDRVVGVYNTEEEAQQGINEYYKDGEW